MFLKGSLLLELKLLLLTLLLPNAELEELKADPLKLLPNGSFE